jgi:C4-dicarboxylate-specific signal transduction histidine kinase
MIGMKVVDVHNDRQMDEYKKAMNEIRTRGSWEGEIAHTKKDGTAFPTRMSVTLLKNEEGKPARILAVARDITKSKRKEEQLRQCREKMAQTEKLAELRTLNATMAHEMTQPLTVIRLSIENLLAELEELQTVSCSSPVVEDLREGLNEISNITSLIDNFRKFARRSSEIPLRQVDLKVIAERIVKLLDQSARLAKVTLRIQGMDELPLIYGLEKDLEQLFFALVENAIQAADGKKMRHITISGAVRDEHVELQFADNCGGIAPENLDRVFEPFFTTKGEDEGTGLGLCTVQNIVFRAQGNVRVKSIAGQGSTFFVALPIN